MSDRRHQVGFLGPPHTGRVTRGSYVGNCGLASTARWFWRWVTSRRSLKGEDWVLSRPENGRTGGGWSVGRWVAHLLQLPATSAPSPHHHRAAHFSSSSSSAGAQISRGGKRGSVRVEGGGGGGGTVRVGGGGGGGGDFPHLLLPTSSQLIRKARVRPRSPVGTLHPHRSG